MYKKIILKLVKNKPQTLTELYSKLSYHATLKDIKKTIFNMICKEEINIFKINEIFISISKIRFQNNTIVSTIKENPKIVKEVLNMLKKEIPIGFDNKLHYIENLEKMSAEIDKIGFQQQLTDMTSIYVNTRLIEYYPNNTIIYNRLYSCLQNKINNRISETTLLLEKDYKNTMYNNMLLVRK